MRDRAPPRSRTDRRPARPRAAGLGVADGNVGAAALYTRLGYADRGLRYRDRWSWVDHDGVVADESAWAAFLVKNLNPG
jgi:hypothetical protein